MAIDLSVDYMTVDGKIKNFTLPVPDDAKVVNGSCSDVAQWLQVSSGKINFTMNFIHDGQTNYALNKMVFEIAPTALPSDAQQSAIHIALENNKTFATPIDRSYYCTRPQVIQVNETFPVAIANVTVSKVHLEAFHKKDSFAFSEVRDCMGGDTPDIVPIAVGIALASLVVVVLIAYLVARRRSPARGYTSM